MRTATYVAWLAGMVMGHAHANSVTLYGLLDSNLEHTSNMRTADNRSRDRLSVQSGGLSGSRWGLRGVEDLGGGWNAVFTLENGFSAATGGFEQGGRLFGRQAFVGLESQSLGRLTLGRQYTAMWSALFDFSPTSYGNHVEPYVVMRGNNARADRTVKYTGTFGPFTTVAHWSFGPANAGGSEGAARSSRRDTALGAGVNYRSGPVSASLSYDQANPSQLAAGSFVGIAENRKAAVAAKYKFAAVEVMAGYRWGKNRDAAKQTVLRDDFYWVGGKYKALAPLDLTLAYYQRDLKNSDAADPWQLTFVAEYALSKQTGIYFTTVYARNAGVNFDGSYPLAPGKNGMRSTSAGIRHRF